MAHFAKINSDGIVTEIIVADQNFIDSGAVGDSKDWVQTSYNTRGGVYYTPNTNIPDPDQSKSFRKNFAGINYTYDTTLDAFIAPQPFPSWILHTESCTWEAPVERPSDGQQYTWNEATLSWDRLE